MPVKEREGPNESFLKDPDCSFYRALLCFPWLETAAECCGFSAVFCGCVAREQLMSGFPKHRNAANNLYVKTEVVTLA